MASLPPILRHRAPSSTAAIAMGPSASVTAGGGDANHVRRGTASAQNPEDPGGEELLLLSELLAPPFKGQQRRDFALSLARHLAEYGAVSGDESKFLANSAAERGGGASVGDAESAGIEPPASTLSKSVGAAVKLSENDSTGGGGVDSNHDRDVSPLRRRPSVASDAARIHERAAVSLGDGGGHQTVSNARSGVDRGVGGKLKRGGDGAVAVTSDDVATEGKPVAVCGGFGKVEGSGTGGDGERRKGPESSTGQGGDASESSWAQEYHDYLCGKET